MGPVDLRLAVPVCPVWNDATDAGPGGPVAGVWVLGRGLGQMPVAFPGFVSYSIRSYSRA